MNRPGGQYDEAESGDAHTVDTGGQTHGDDDTVNPMPIRRAKPADIPAMHAIRTSVRENRLSRPDRIDHEMYRVRLEETGAGWVFEEDGTVLGFAVADTATRSVWALFVSPDAEGRGVGRALLHELTACLFAQGADPIWLTTAPGTRAERFYREAGWRETGREANGELRFETTPSR